MWSILLTSLIALASDILLPALLKWLELFERTLANSTAAKKLLKKASPATFEEFAAIFPKLVEVALDDAAVTKGERAKVLLLSAVVGRPVVLKSLWNRMCLDAKASADWQAADDVGYAELIKAAR